MAAFLWALNGLITGKSPLGQVGVLYVSPLKALNNDIRKNLTKPLSELKAVFACSGAHLPPIGVAIKSGGTSQSERRRMVRYPPEILITTLSSLISSLRCRLGACRGVGRRICLGSKNRPGFYAQHPELENRADNA